MENHHKLFYPANSRFSKDDLNLIVSETRNCLSRKFPGEVTNNKGKFSFSDRAMEGMRSVGRVISVLSDNPDQLRLPDNKSERLALAKFLVDGQTEFGGEIDIICPVCPDYGKDSHFYRTMGAGLSPEAVAGVQSATIILNELPKAGFRPNLKIIVADTEDDYPEIINNCAGGDINFYRSQARESVMGISSMLGGFRGASVQTFTEMLGAEFRSTQYKFEQIIRVAMKQDSSFARLVAKVGSERVSKHSQILGRPELNYELTIRYMAQYAGLGHIARKNYPTILMNYQTPNRQFYNAASLVSRNIRIDDSDLNVIPVIGSVVRR